MASGPAMRDMKGRENVLNCLRRYMNGRRLSGAIVRLGNNRYVGEVASKFALSNDVNKLNDLGAAFAHLLR
jgi:hypothetical protein